MPALLACVGALPAHVEHIVPSLREAERRGWELRFAIEGPWVGPYLESQGFRRDRMTQTGGRWRGITLTMPQADAVFSETKPDAAFVSPSGHGYPGGAWLEECHRRRVPAVEFLNDCYPFVWWHGEETRGLTDLYLEKLKAVGYGLEMHGCLTMTDAQRWVGLPIGDRLTEKVNVWAALGLRRKKPYVLVSPPWTKDPEKAKELSDDLRLYLEMARAGARSLVMSLHPNARYAEGAVEAINVPRGVTLTSCWPGSVWGREVKACPTMALAREADFVIHTYRTGHSHLCLAAGKAMWLKRMMHAHSRKWTEESLAAMFKGERPPVTKETFSVLFDQDLLVRFRAMETSDTDARRMRPFWDVPWYYRGEDKLKGLFADDLKGFSGTDEERRDWQESFQLRVDGKVARRIVDLIDFDSLFKRGWAKARQIHGWFTPADLKVMLELALQVPKGGVIVEVGVWKGMSFMGMSVAAEDKRHVAVDHFLGSDETWHQEDPQLPWLKHVFKANLKKFGVKAKIMAESSLEAAKRFGDASVDLLLLDGSHVPEDIMEDIEAWWPKIKVGGRMAFHDWEKPWIQEVILEAGKRWKWQGMERAPYLYVARKRQQSTS